MRKLVLMVLIGLAPAGCTADDGERQLSEGGGGRTASPSVVAAPSGRPPGGNQVEHPPPAWVESSEGSFWLAYDSSCWETACVDYVDPGERDDVPTIKAHRGDLVTFHLRIQPKKLVLYGEREGSRVRLEPKSDAAWRVTQGGFLRLDAEVPGRGGAAYIFNIVLN